ncbi:MAG TPA: carboxypeptidase-like regulatory domain-containing protein, partial [Flavisolibacter sp.]|nr:carboxypeptidase-like regulatory domain-containing protein [Flavisolibacter sp.]
MRTLMIAAGKLCKSKNLVLSCFLILASTVLWAQEKTVTGVVKNAEDGSPLAKASVLVKGTKIMTATDDKGAFSIKASSNQVLVVSVVGFKAM